MKNALKYEAYTYRLLDQDLFFLITNAGRKFLNEVLFLKGFLKMPKCLAKKYNFNYLFAGGSFATL